MDLLTDYMGLHLKNPVVVAASPLSTNLDLVRQMEDNGAAAIVMYSLFEEQIHRETDEVDRFLATHNKCHSEALSYFPEPEKFRALNTNEYLEHIQVLKKTIDIPVIGSLNGISPGGWMHHAKRMEEAGADGIELNIYYISTDPALSASDIEDMYLSDLQAVKSEITIPIALKVGPYFSAFTNMAMKLDKAGADALVLFNRFYQPDIDLESREVIPNLHFSSSYDIRLSLRWIAILYGMVRSSLAATSGIHTADDALKLIMAGADAVMIASVILKEGPKSIARILKNMEEWMETHQYESISKIKGSLSYQNIAEPAALLRANYVATLQNFKTE